jgi:hypothetical protein
MSIAILERNPHVILVHQALTSGFGTSAGGTGFTVDTTFLRRPVIATNSTVAGLFQFFY